jgi:hypothetical protein
MQMAGNEDFEPRLQRAPATMKKATKETLKKPDSYEMAGL